MINKDMVYDRNADYDGTGSRSRTQQSVFTLYFKSLRLYVVYGYRGYACNSRLRWTWTLRSGLQLDLSLNTSDYFGLGGCEVFEIPGQRRSRVVDIQFASEVGLRQTSIGYTP